MYFSPAISISVFYGSFIKSTEQTQKLIKIQGWLIYQIHLTWRIDLGHMLFFQVNEHVCFKSKENKSNF